MKSSHEESLHQTDERWLRKSPGMEREVLSAGSSGEMPVSVRLKNAELAFWLSGHKSNTPTTVQPPISRGRFSVD